MVVDSAATPESLSPTERAISLALRHLPVRHGKHRLLDKLLPKPMGNGKRTVLTSYHGRALYIDIDDLVGWHFAMLRSFDPEVVEVLISATAPDEEDVFWDIGANKGAHAYAVGAALPRAKIVAIEPQASLTTNLLRNLETVSAGRYEHYEVGIGEKNETMDLVIPEGNGGRATLHPDRMSAIGATTSIQLVTAQHLQTLSAYGWPTLVKIDVEGHEPSVIKSLAPALKTRACKAIVFENHATECVALATIAEVSAEHEYTLYGIRKTLFSTYLVPTSRQVAGVTDYVIVDPSIPKQYPAFGSMIRHAPN